jgi:predicted nucleotidyltransferase
MEINDTLTEHLKTILKALQECRIEYALAGGLAYSALVEPRATMDIDLLILLQDKSIQDFFHLLQERFDSLIVHKEPMQFHLVKIWRAVSFKNNRELILDFLLAESPFHQNALQRAIKLEFSGITLKVITLEDLILLKQCANRPQDVADVANIYAMFKDEIDHNYIEFWSKKLNIE